MRANWEELLNLRIKCFSRKFYTICEGLTALLNGSCFLILTSPGSNNIGVKNHMSNSNNQEEVKEFVQVVEADNTATEEEIEEATEGIEEEEDTSAQSSEQETEDESEETEEEQGSNESEGDHPDDLKEVQGETAKERALRFEVTRLKKVLRQTRTGDLLVKKTDVTPTIDQEDEELKQYDPEELKRFEKLALKMGFAKKDEIYHQTMQERLDNEFNSFIEAHPEYLPENDSDGLLWNQLKEEFQLYQQPKDPKVLKKILTKIHNDISGIKPANNLNKINASREKIKVASHSGAAASKTITKAPKVNLSSSSVRSDALRGFTEEEIAELLAD